MRKCAACQHCLRLHTSCHVSRRTDPPMSRIQLRTNVGIYDGRYASTCCTDSPSSRVQLRTDVEINAAGAAMAKRQAVRREACSVLLIQTVLRRTQRPRRCETQKTTSPYLAEKNAQSYLPDIRHLIAEQGIGLTNDHVHERDLTCSVMYSGYRILPWLTIPKVPSAAVVVCRCLHAAGGGQLPRRRK